jgi:NDP-sugar pyrophosphorylase family protein
MILAAGFGLRMRPLSLLRAKPALPVLNRPLVHWTLERLARGGVTDVVINLHHLPDTIRGEVGTGRRFGLRVRYSHEPRILGTGGGPRSVRDFFGDEPCLVVNGDIWFEFDLERLLARHRAAGALATLALKRNPDPSRYSPVILGPAGEVRAIAGRPRPRRGTPLLFTGVHILEPRLLERLPRGASDSVRDLYLPALARGERIAGVVVRGAWYDLGTPELYLRAQRRLLRRAVTGVKGGVAIHASARAERGARISASVVGPHCRIGQGATIEGSVLWERVRIGRGARVRGAILTTGAEVRDGERVSGVRLKPSSCARIPGQG